jgi:hypothetical protein
MLDIRTTENIKKYKDSKSFIFEYESEKASWNINKTIFKSFYAAVWFMREQIAIRYNYLKKEKDFDPNSPYALQINSRKGYIIEQLRKRYKRKENV